MSDKVKADRLWRLHKEMRDTGRSYYDAARMKDIPTHLSIGYQVMWQRCIQIEAQILCSIVKVDPDLQHRPDFKNNKR